MEQVKISPNESIFLPELLFLTDSLILWGVFWLQIKDRLSVFAGHQPVKQLISGLRANNSNHPDEDKKECLVNKERRWVGS